MLTTTTMLPIRTSQSASAREIITANLRRQDHDIPVWYARKRSRATWTIAARRIEPPVDPPLMAYLPRKPVVRRGLDGNRAASSKQPAGGSMGSVIGGSSATFFMFLRQH